MPRKKKHPMHMTDDEALNHIFHPEIAKAVRKHLKDGSEKRAKPQEAGNVKRQPRKEA